MGMRAAATPCITRGQQDQRLAQKNEFRTFEPPPLARIPCKHRLDEKRRDEKKPRELAGQSHGWGETSKFSHHIPSHAVSMNVPQLALHFMKLFHDAVFGGLDQKKCPDRYGIG